MNLHELLDDQEVLKIIENASNSKNVTILSWKLEEKDGELTGFLGGYLKLYVEATLEKAKNTRSFTFFVKTLPTGSEQIEFMKSTNLFNKEATIYTNILEPILSSCDIKFAAQSYFSRDDILVLDDLTLQGYALMPARVDFSQDHLKIVLKTLAEMHASSIYFERSALKGATLEEKYDKTLFEVSINRDNLWFITGMKTIEIIALKRSKYSTDAIAVQLIKDKFLKGLDRVYDLLRNVSKKFKRVICHCDIWRNNLMFKFETSNGETNFSKPIDCVLVDFQLARCLPPADDIMMTLYVLQRSSIREKNYLEYLTHYHTCLEKSLTQFKINIEAILPFDELLESCEHFRMLGALLKAIYLQTTHLPLGEMEKLRKDDEKYQNFILNDRSLLLKYIDTDKYFREWILEAVEELIEMIIFEKKCNGNSNETNFK